MIGRVAGAGTLAPLHLVLDGALGERIAVGPPEQARTMVVFVMSRRAQEESSAFGRTVDEHTLDADLESVAIVDLRRYGGWLRRLASARLHRAAEDALARRRARRPPHSDEQAIRRWHLVGDFDGSLLGRFAVAPDPAHPLAFVLDRGGALHGPFHQVAEVLTAVAAAAHVAPP